MTPHSGASQPRRAFDSMYASQPQLETRGRILFKIQDVCIYLLVTQAQKMITSPKQSRLDRCSSGQAAPLWANKFGCCTQLAEPRHATELSVPEASRPLWEPVTPVKPQCYSV